MDICSGRQRASRRLGAAGAEARMHKDGDDGEETLLLEGSETGD